MELKERPKVGIGVIIRSQGKILLGKRKGPHGAGFWAAAGGHLEFGETVEECAKRELFEETGLEALSISLGPWTSDVIDRDKHYVTLFVFVDAFQGEVCLKEPDKCEGWHWFDHDSVPAPLFPSIVHLFQKIGIEEVFQLISSSTKKSD